MRRIDTPDGLFHQSKPGDPTPSTRVVDWWLNGIQEELCYVIEKLGRLQLSDSDNTLVGQSIERYLKFGPPPTTVDIPGASPNPIDLGVDLEADGGYFYIFSCMSEQFGTSVTVTPFNLVAFKDSTSKKWKGFQQDFIPGQKAPVSIHVGETGKLSLTTTNDWGTVKGKSHLSITKREKQIT